MVARNQVARRPRGLAMDFRAAPAGAYALYKAGSRALQPQTKDRKTSKGKGKGKGKSAVGALPKNRIGRNNGLIVSNQKVPRPKAGSVQYRRTRFGSAEEADKVWLGGSTIGDTTTHFQTIAHAILAHYMPKMGDLRSSNVQAPSGIKVFTSYVLHYAKDAPSDLMSGADFVLGVALPNADYSTMATALGEQLREQARRGLFPMSIAFDLSDGGTVLSVLRDQELGRHVITVACNGKFRFQNVTAGSTSESININAVDASPVNGKIYTFRNQAPLFSSSYAATVDAGTQLGIEKLQAVQAPFDVYGKTVVPADGKGGDAFTHIVAPPLNPKSIWRNVSSTGTAVFPPGGFKTYQTSYLRSDTIKKYCQVISQQDFNPTASTYNNAATYPPAGDSFMMCLRPTLKAESGEIIKMLYNVEHIMTASIKRRKPSPLQVVNLIE